MNKNKVDFLEAAAVVANYENLSITFVLDTMSKYKIVARCRAIHREREKMIDDIRAEW